MNTTLEELEAIHKKARAEVSVVQSFKAFAIALKESIPAYASQIPKIEEELRIAKINAKACNHVRLRKKFPLELPK